MISIPHPVFPFTCCCFSASCSLWVELWSILEYEHMLHANGGDLHTTNLLFLFSKDLITPSPVFKTSFSLPRRDWLQHLKIVFLTQLSLFRWFLSWHLGWKVPKDHTGPWATASPSLTTEPTSPFNLQVRECGWEEGYPHWVGASPELLLSAESRECVGVLHDPLISVDCFLSNILLFYPHSDLLMLRIWVGRWSLPCCW